MNQYTMNPALAEAPAGKDISRRELRRRLDALNVSGDDAPESQNKNHTSAPPPALPRANTRHRGQRVANFFIYLVLILMMIVWLIPFVCIVLESFRME